MPEVKTHLTLQDDVTPGLGNVENKVDDVEKAEKKANDGFKEWAQTGAHIAQTLGTNLGDIIGRVKALGASFIQAGADAESGDQAVAALITTAQGKSFAEARDQAEQLGDTIDDIGVRAGISGEKLGAAFQIILEKSGATESGIANATDQLGKMAVVASNLDKDAEGIANEFAFMQEGVLKTKGQLFQLLQSTGIFGKNTKTAAESWAKLTEGKRAELLSYGLDKLSGQMSKMPPTFKQAEAGFENMLRVAKESIGQPLIEELTPALQDATEELIKMGPEISEFGRTMAKDVAAGIREGGKQLKDAVGWLRDHKDEIAQGFREGAEKVKEVVGFILAHKEEIALAFGAKAVMPVAQGAASVVGGAAKGVTGLMGSTGSAFEQLGFVGTKAELAAAQLGLLGAAIVALGALALAEKELIDGLDESYDRRIGGLKKLKELSESGNVENTENAVRTMRQLDEAAGKMTPQLNAFYDSMVDGAKRAQRITQADNDQLADTIEAGASTAQNAGSATGADAANAAQNSLALLLNAYNQASQQGNTAMATLAAQTLASSGMVSKAFLDSSKEIEGGFNTMADLLLASGSQFAGFAAQLKGKAGASAPKAPVINMSGGQTFNIKQDFRQQDPDRVAIQFKKDVGKMASQRLQSRFAGPFGG